MNPVDVLNQINRLTTDVIKVGICEAQNFPSMKSYPGDIREIGCTRATVSFGIDGRTKENIGKAAG